MNPVHLIRGPATWAPLGRICRARYRAPPGHTPRSHAGRGSSASKSQNAMAIRLGHFCHKKCYYGGKFLRPALFEISPEVAPHHTALGTQARGIGEILKVGLGSVQPQKILQRLSCSLVKIYLGATSVTAPLSNLSSRILPHNACSGTPVIVQKPSNTPTACWVIATGST